jgi:hypothetical protein
MKMKLSPLVRAIFIPDAPKNLKAVKRFEFNYTLGKFSISRIVKAISFPKALGIIRKQVPTAIVQSAREVAR